MSSTHHWNCQHPDWPNFVYDPEVFAALEQSFMESAGRLPGLSAHVDEESHIQLMIESLSQEAITTSEIEGEFLSRDSVDASLRRRFGLSSDPGRMLIVSGRVDEPGIHLRPHRLAKSKMKWIDFCPGMQAQDRVEQFG